MSEARTPAEQETEHWLSYIMGTSDEKPPVRELRLMWTDPQSGNEHRIYPRGVPINADGTVHAFFADGVSGVFHMRDCRTA